MYSDSDPLLATITTYTQGDGVTEAEGGPAGLAAIATIANMVSSSQGITSNIVGDEVNSLLQELAGDGFEDDDVMNLMVRGFAAPRRCYAYCDFAAIVHQCSCRV